MTNLDQARAAKDKGAALLLKGKNEAALEQFQRAVDLTPDDVVARRKVADLLARLGKRDAAVAAYQHVAGRFAADGQLAQAIAISKLILQLDPTHTRTQEALAQLYARKTGGPSQGQWTAKVPPEMAGALNLRHVKQPVAPPPAPCAPAASPTPGLAPPPLAGAPAMPEPVPATPIAPVSPEPVEIDIEIDVGELPRAPLFSELPREMFVALLRDVAMRVCVEGEALVREGDPAHSMYVLAQGHVKVVRGHGTPQERTVAEMAEGTCFGEIGLLADVPRLASVVAVGECVVLEVTRDLLVGLGARFPGLEEILQRFYRERLLANLLRSSPLFSSFAEPALLALADRFALRKAAAEELLVKEGEPGEALFVLLRGRCEPFHEGADGQRHPYPTMVEGAVFGEIALLRDGRASASVRTATECLLLALDRESFRSQVLANEDARKKLEALRDQRLQRTVELLLQLGPEYAAWV